MTWPDDWTWPTTGAEALALIRGLLTTELFAISGTSVTGATLLAFFVVIAVTFWLAGFFQRALERLLIRRSGQTEGTAGVASRLLRYLVLVIGLSVGLRTIGIDLSALFAAGALFAVAIGFAMQNVVANFVSGVILLIERVIKPGDILEVDGQMVRVRDIGIRATLVHTLDDEDLVLPNSMLVQSTVKNYTMQDRTCRIRVAVGVAYESDLRLVRQTLERCLREVPWRSQRRDPVLLLDNFGSSSVDYEASVWVDDPWRSRTLRSQLREAIWWALKEEGIVIAFPQLDVHFDEPALSAIAAKSIA